MPGASSKLSILIEAKNNSSAAIKTVQSDLKGLDSAAKSMAGGLSGLAGAAGAAGIVALGTAAAGAVVEMARGAAETERLATAFDGLAAAAGQSGDAMLSAMQEASRGTISNAELMGSANRAMLLGVADSAEEMAQLLDIAAARGKAMGESTAQAFSDIVTGIGRGSALILDNLGIVVDAVAANETYAKSIGKSADELTEAEKKQALFNAVIADSTEIVKANEGAADDAASNYERMDAALANAKDALGQLFSPAIAAIAQNLADAVVQVTDAITHTDIEVAQQKMHDLGVEIGKLAEEYENAKLATSVALLHPEMMAQAQSDLLAAQQQLRAFGTEYNKAAAITGAPLLDLDALNRGIIAFDEATMGLNKLAAAGPAAASGLGQVGMSADALKDRLAQLKAQSDATASALAGITSAAIGAIHSAASAAVGIMPSSEIAKIYTQTTKNVAAQTEIMHQYGMTVEEIDFKTQEYAKKASLPFDLAVEAARAAEKQNTATAKSVDSLSQEYQNLAGKVQGVLSGALDPGVGVDPSDILENLGFPREDAINENARRLADIAANGLKGQDWLGEFQNEVPDIWNMIRLAQNPQEEAARLLQDFQDGLLTSPIDKAKAKEIVKRSILGDQNMAALATEIATELAAEMGIPMQEALAAAQGTLGGGKGMGSEAATTFSEDALAAMEDEDGGGSFVSTFVDQARAKYSLLATAGTDAAKTWGDAFLAKVGDSVPPALINLLTDLVTPEVVARMNQRGTLTGAVP